MITLNIYRSLNEITKYIDDNLDDNIDYNVLAKFLGVNVYTMQKVIYNDRGYFFSGIY